MKKYFVISDSHSFFTETEKALINAGFDIKNSEHILITCGDMFDRGLESKQMLNFLYSLFKLNRLISIKGNHDDLFQEMITRKDYYDYDISNGTIQTLADLQPESVSTSYAIYSFPVCCSEYDKRIDELYFNSVDFYETKNYIFVHGWIPDNEDPNIDGLYDPNWRNATRQQWHDARWKNPFKEWKLGVREPNKTIVCGHWHSSWAWSHLKHDRKEFPPKNRKNWEKSFEPFTDDGIIGLDAATSYSNLVNVLILNKDEI